jgi:mRNA interferase MazF
MICPERGDLIKCDFDNAVGHEQADFRRALVISPTIYNSKLKMALVCAITNQKKGFVFEVDIPKGLKVTGVLLTDQLRTIDWQARNVEIVDHLPKDVFEKVTKKIIKLIE